MPSLLGMPTELAILILEYLIPTKRPSRDCHLYVNGVKERREEPESLSEGISDLTDLVSISYTCKELRAAVAPILFRNIILRDTEHSGQSIQVILDGPLQCCVHQIHYQAGASIPKMYFTHRHASKYLLPSVERLLSSLSRFRKLSKLIVEFPYDCDEPQEPLGSYETFVVDQAHNPDEIMELYQTLDERDKMYGLHALYAMGVFSPDSPSPQKDHHHEPDCIADDELLNIEADMLDSTTDDQLRGWRGFIDRVCEAIGRNRTNTLKALEWRGFAPVVAPSYRTQQFYNLLGCLNSFSYKGRDDTTDHYKTSGKSLTSASGYDMDLSSSFFNHLTSLRHLSVVGSNVPYAGLPGVSFLSSYGQRRASFSRIPHLQSIHIANALVSEELAEFIAHHALTVEKIDLDHCFARLNHRYNAKWDSFFDSLSNAKLSNLKTLQIKQCSPSPTVDISKHEDVTDITEVTSAHIEETIATDAGRPFFSYKCAEYELAVDDDLASSVQFEKQVDQRAYNKLLAFIERQKLEALDVDMTMSITRLGSG